MSRIRRVDILLLAALGLALPAGAATRPLVALRCQIKAPSLTALYGPAASTQIATNLCKEMQKRLKEHRTLSLWEYGQGDSQVALLFKVVDGPLGDTLVQMDLLLANESVRDEGPWERRWRTAADAALGNDPTAVEAPRVLAGALAPLLKDASLEESMRQKVPIAAGGRLLRAESGPPKIVSPLPWQQFERLKKSKFRVSCAWPGRSEGAFLESKGLAGPASFDPDGADPAYDALVMVASRRQVGDDFKSVDEVLNEVFELQPRWIFLQQYEHPDVEVFAP